jgi:hypothetical protein
MDKFNKLFEQIMDSDLDEYIVEELEFDPETMVYDDEVEDDEELEEGVQKKKVIRNGKQTKVFVVKKGGEELSRKDLKDQGKKLNPSTGKIERLSSKDKRESKNRSNAAEDREKNTSMKKKRMRNMKKSQKKTKRLGNMSNED